MRSCWRSLRRMCSVMRSMDVSGAVRPLGGGLGALGRGRGVGLDLGGVGAAAAVGGGGKPAVAPLGAGLAGATRGRGGATDMDFALRLDGGFSAAPPGLDRFSAADAAGAGAGPLAGDDAGDGGAGGTGELSLADLLGQISIPQQLELLMGLPQHQMMEVLKQLPHTQQVELLLALQEDRQNRVVAERQQQQQPQQQPWRQQQQPNVRSPQQQVFMLGTLGLRAAAGTAAVAAGGGGSGPGLRPLNLDREDAAGGAGGLLESLAAGARLNLAPLGPGGAGTRGVALRDAGTAAAVKALAALQEQDAAEDERPAVARMEQGGGKAGGATQAAAQTAAARAAGHAAVGGARAQPIARGIDQGDAGGKEGKPEAPEQAAKASGGDASAGRLNGNSGPVAAAPRQPVTKQQQQQEEQPKSEGNNAAGQASGRAGGGDEDSGKDNGDRPAATTTQPAGGAAADASGDTSAARPSEAGGAAAEAADAAEAAGAAYSCEEVLERLSLKLHGVRPEELAPNVAQRMRSWLESMDAVTLQGTLRSGCVNLVLDISYRQPLAAAVNTLHASPAVDAAGDRSVWAFRLAAAAIASSLGLELSEQAAEGRERQRGDGLEGGHAYRLCREAAALAAARGIRVQIQIGNRVVYPRQEEQPHGAQQQQHPVAVEVHEIAPLAVVRGDHAVAVMSARNLDTPAARLHVRLNGRRLGALVQPQRELPPPAETPVASPPAVANAAGAAATHLHQRKQHQKQELVPEQDGDECVLVFLDPPSQAGLAVLEWEAGGGAGVLGDWWPLVVAPDEHVAAEVNALALDPATTAGTGPDWLRALLVDVGLVLDAVHNPPPGGLRAGMEPGVLERLVRRARCVAPFCEARAMPHTAAVARAFLAAAAAEADEGAQAAEADDGAQVAEADDGAQAEVVAVSSLSSRASSSLSSACGSDFSDSEREDSSLETAGCTGGVEADTRLRDGDSQCPDASCELDSWLLGRLPLGEAA